MCIDSLGKCNVSASQFDTKKFYWKVKPYFGDEEMRKYDIRTSLKPSGLQIFIGSTTSRDDDSLKQLSLALGYLQITTGLLLKFIWEQGECMIVSSEKLVCSLWVYVRSYERINYEKQNEIYLKISSDLYWETKFARLRSLESRRKCALGVKSEPTEKKLSHFERKLHLRKAIILI